MFGSKEVKLSYSQAVYIHSALLETIERYTQHRKESAAKYGEYVCDVYDIAIREMVSSLTVLEGVFPDLLNK